MSAPVHQFDKLSIGSMPPETRSKTRLGSSNPPEDESSSESESVSGSSDIDDEDPSLVKSPSKLVYQIDHLPETTRATVHDTFREPPDIALQKCRLINDTYAFQMTELVTRSVRIRDSGSGSSQLSCSCAADEKPCQHILWLLDRILQQTLYAQDSSMPLKMTPEGFAEEMGDPFRSIATHHLDILADGIHCQLVTPDSEYHDEVDIYRAQESRELLSSIYKMAPEDYRLDLFPHPTLGKKIIKRHDLDQTILRMLLDNHHFFHYFYAISRPTDPIKDPFRKISQRIDHVLRDLDAFSSSPNTEASAETPQDVPWAAMHIIGSIGLVKSAIFLRDQPLLPSEATSAARCLIHILDAVSSRNRDAHPGPRPSERNLYLRLIGDRDSGFVIEELNLIPEAASQFLHSLEEIMDRIGVHGAPASYVNNYRSLLNRLRTSTRGSKRQGQGSGSDRRSKRMK